MKVFIAVDMEGVAGVVSRDHTSPDGFDYQHARRWMTGEANAAVSGAVEAGADEVWVSDCHGGNGCRNILLHEVHPKTQLLTGTPKPLGGPLALNESFDALMLVGLHVRNGAFGVISHTVNGRVVDDLRINGIPFGEVGLIAGVAGHFGVPTVLVTGDDQTAVEATELMPWVDTVVVKWALTRQAARCLPHEQACEVIQAGARKALAQVDAAKPLQVATPVNVELKFKDTGMADGAATVPGTTLLSASTVGYRADDFLSANQAIRTMIGEAWAVART